MEIFLFDSLTSVIYKGVEEPWSAPLSGMALPRQVDNAAQPGDSARCVHDSVRFGGTGVDWAGNGDQEREGPRAVTGARGRHPETRRRTDRELLVCRPVAATGGCEGEDGQVKVD